MQDSQDHNNGKSVSEGIWRDEFAFMAWGDFPLDDIFREIMFRVEFTRNNHEQLCVLMWTIRPVSLRTIYELIDDWNSGKPACNKCSLIWVSGEENENIMTFSRKNRCVDQPFYKYMEVERLKTVVPWAVGGSGSKWGEISVYKIEDENEDADDDYYYTPASLREVELYRQMKEMEADKEALGRRHIDERRVSLFILFCIIYEICLVITGAYFRIIDFGCGDRVRHSTIDLFEGAISTGPCTSL